MEQTFSHIPVLLEETLELLDPARDGIYVDGTLGGAGHAEEIAKRLTGRGHLYGFDRDADAIAEATKRLEPYRDHVTIFQVSFNNETRF